MLKKWPINLIKKKKKKWPINVTSFKKKIRKEDKIKLSNGQFNLNGSIGKLRSKIKHKVDNRNKISGKPSKSS